MHSKDKALCSDLETGNTCPAIPMIQTDAYIMFDPPTWKALQDYIDALIRLAKKKETGVFSRKSSEDQELLDVLYKIKFMMKRSDENWKS